MKKHGKLISFILAAAMLLALLPAGLIASAEAAAETANGRCGNGLTWELDSYGNLIITGTGDMWDYLADSQIPWGREVKSVSIGDGVTSGGDCAFYEGLELAEVSLPSTIKRIGFAAFWSCVALTEIDIPDGATEIGNAAFSECVSLASISVPDSVTTVGSGAFVNTAYYCDCSSNWEDGMLYMGKCLISADCYDVGGVCVIKDGTVGIATDAFSFCRELTGVSIPKSVRVIGESVFGYCTALTDVTIPRGVTEIKHGLFLGCAALKEVDIPDGVTSIGYIAFCDCPSLERVRIPASVTGIRDDAFHGCPGLTLEVYEGSFAQRFAEEQGVPYRLLTSGPCGDGLTWEFADGDKLALVISGEGAMYDFGANGAPWGNGIKSVTFGDGAETIGDYAFAFCSGLSELTLPGSVVSVGYRAFIGCGGLTDVIVPEGVTSIGEQAFYGCGALAGVTLPESVTFIGGRALPNRSKLVVRVYKDSYAHRYAVENGYKYELIGVAAAKGDPDGDGEITVADALIALRVAAKLVAQTEALLAACDVDGSGDVDVGDALAILRVAAKLEVL